MDREELAILVWVACKILELNFTFILLWLSLTHTPTNTFIIYITYKAFTCTPLVKHTYTQAHLYIRSSAKTGYSRRSTMVRLVSFPTSGWKNARALLKENASLHATMCESSRTARCPIVRLTADCEFSIFFFLCSALTAAADCSNCSRLPNNSLTSHLAAIYCEIAVWRLRCSALASSPAAAVPSKYHVTYT